MRDSILCNVNCNRCGEGHDADDVGTTCRECGSGIVRAGYTLEPVRFCFMSDDEFEGYTDRSTWNGFDNVWVEHDVLLQIRADLADPDDPEDPFSDVERDETGLYSLANGFATTVLPPMVAGINRPGETPGYDSRDFPTFDEARDWLIERIEAAEGLESVADRLREANPNSEAFEVERKGGPTFYIERRAY